MLAGALVAVVAAGGFTTGAVHSARGAVRVVASVVPPGSTGPAANAPAPLKPQPQTHVAPPSQRGPSSSTKTPPKPAPPPPPVVWTTTVGLGARGPLVQQIQQRLAWTGIAIKVTGVYDTATASAVRSFQVKQQLSVTGTVTRSTYDRLWLVTRTNGALDPRCTGTRVMCIDKSQKVLRYLVDGKLVMTLDVRFGSIYLPTREGVFAVYAKDANHVSTIYHTPMPYAMFFSGGQAVHYSKFFAADGYSGNSHGCVNVRDLTRVIELFNSVTIGTKVVIYRTAPSIG
jgi:peptidoglycan hydrolase-like protein with peptidoglycan-binding domain